MQKESSFSKCLQVPGTLLWHMVNKMPCFPKDSGDQSPHGVTNAWSAHLDQAGPTPKHIIKLASMCFLPSFVSPGCQGEEKGKPNLEPALRVLRCGEKPPGWPRWARVMLCLCPACAPGGWPPGTAAPGLRLFSWGCVSPGGGPREVGGGREWPWCSWPVLQQVSLSTALLCLQLRPRSLHPRDCGSRWTHTSTPQLPALGTFSLACWHSATLLGLCSFRERTLSASGTAVNIQRLCWCTAGDQHVLLTE